MVTDWRRGPAPILRAVPCVITPHGRTPKDWEPVRSNTRRRSPDASKQPGFGVLQLFQMAGVHFLWSFYDWFKLFIEIFKELLRPDSRTGV